MRWDMSDRGCEDTHEHCWNVMLDYVNHHYLNEKQVFVEFWSNLFFLFFRVDLRYTSSFLDQYEYFTGNKSNYYKDHTMYRFNTLNSVYTSQFKHDYESIPIIL